MSKPNGKLSYLGKIGIFLNDTIVKIALFGMICVVGLNVFTRYILDYSFRWSGEINILLFTYLSFFGIPIALRANNHVSITYFKSRFSKKMQKIISVFVDIVMIMVLFYLIYYSIIVIQRLGMEPMPATKLPKFWFYIPIPISSGVMIIDMIIKLIKDIKE